MNLKHLVDSVLLADTKRLATKERQITLEILQHLREIDRRRLYSELGYSSLFDYSVRELGYSDAAAMRRIKASRLISEMPYIEKKIIDGNLSLTNLAMVGNLFKQEHITLPEIKKEILHKIENTTTRECERLLMDYQTSLVPPREELIPTTPTITTLKVNFSSETVVLLEEIKQVMAHHRFSNDQLFKRIFKTALIEFRNTKFKNHSKKTSAPPSPRVKRYVPAMIKKAVYERDQGKCTKCKSSYKLEYDHIRPFSLGGETTIENLRLRCFSCNQRSGVAGRIINKAK